MHHFYVSSNENLNIIESDIIRGVKAYYVEWVYEMEKHRMYMTKEEIKYVADAMMAFVGDNDESTKAWKNLYKECDIVLQ